MRAHERDAREIGAGQKLGATKADASAGRDNTARILELIVMARRERETGFRETGDFYRRAFWPKKKSPALDTLFFI
jgi:hypothetical protein